MSQNLICMQIKQQSSGFTATQICITKQLFMRLGVCMSVLKSFRFNVFNGIKWLELNNDELPSFHLCVAATCFVIIQKVAANVKYLRRRR